MITESLPKKYSVSSYYYLGARQEMSQPTTNRCHGKRNND
jgi:hypothetical protein